MAPPLDKNAFEIEPTNQMCENPLTASEVVQVCVMPVCLYESENWLLTDPMLLTL